MLFQKEGGGVSSAKISLGEINWEKKQNTYIPNPYLKTELHKQSKKSSKHHNYKQLFLHLFNLNGKLANQHQPPPPDCQHLLYVESSIK